MNSGEIFEAPPSNAEAATASAASDKGTEKSNVAGADGMYLQASVWTPADCIRCTARSSLIHGPVIALLRFTTCPTGFQHPLILQSLGLGLAPLADAQHCLSRWSPRRYRRAIPP